MVSTHMTKVLGKVVEVFIPDKDVMNSEKIGFKVLVDKEVIEIVQEQNEINSYILREDEVLITKEIKDNEKYIDIELYDGEDYE